MFNLKKTTICCIALFMVTVSARPQVWNIGFNPDPSSFQFPDGIDQQIPTIDSTTASPAVQTTTPSAAYYDCLSRCPTTSEYNPICGSDSVNYHNLGRLQCAVRCGTNVTMVRGGTCMPL